MMLKVRKNKVKKKARWWCWPKIWEEESLKQKRRKVDEKEGGRSGKRDSLVLLWEDEVEGWGKE